MRTIKTDRIISEKRISMSLSFGLSEFLKVKKIDPNFKKFIEKKSIGVQNCIKNYLFLILN